MAARPGTVTRKETVARSGPFVAQVWKERHPAGEFWRPVVMVEARGVSSAQEGAANRNRRVAVADAKDMLAEWRRRYRREGSDDA